MSVLKPMQLSVERDQSGGVRVGFGSAIGLMSPDQTVEFALVLLKAAGVEVNLGEQFRLPAQKHFRAG
jgi:hypothetical protein